MVRPDRFELPTFWFVARRSIQLSYGRKEGTPPLYPFDPLCATARRPSRRFRWPSRPLEPVRKLPQIMAHNPGFLKLVDEAKARIRQTDIDGYKKMLAAGERPLLIDTREDTEWEQAHAAGAIHLSKGIIERDIETRIPDKSTKMVLYCGGGFRSALAADALQRMGYNNVISLDGGWRAWQQSGMPVEK